MKFWLIVACLAALAGPARAELPPNYDPNAMCETMAQKALHGSGPSAYQIIKNDCLRREKAGYFDLSDRAQRITIEHRHFCVHNLMDTEVMLYERLSECVDRFLEQDTVEPPFRP